MAINVQSTTQTYQPKPEKVKHYTGRGAAIGFATGAAATAGGYYVGVNQLGPLKDFIMRLIPKSAKTKVGKFVAIAAVAVGGLTSIVGAAIGRLFKKKPQVPKEEVSSEKVSNSPKNETAHEQFLRMTRGE